MENRHEEQPEGGCKESCRHDRRPERPEGACQENGVQRGLVSPDLLVQFVALVVHEGPDQSETFITAEFKRSSKRQQRIDKNREGDHGEAWLHFFQPIHRSRFANGGSAVNLRCRGPLGSWLRRLAKTL